MPQCILGTACYVECDGELLDSGVEPTSTHLLVVTRTTPFWNKWLQPGHFLRRHLGRLWARTEVAKREGGRWDAKRWGVRATASQSDGGKSERRRRKGRTTAEERQNDSGGKAERRWSGRTNRYGGASNGGDRWGDARCEDRGRE